MAAAANFTRRRDLFADAGCPSPDAVAAALVGRAEALGIVARDKHGAVADEASLRAACRKATEGLPAILRPVCAAAPEYFFEKKGDLATFLWLLRSMAPEASDDILADALFAVTGGLLEGGRPREASCLLRFLVAVDFDFGDVFKELGVAYGFFQSREPNPFVWKSLEFFDTRARESVHDDYRCLNVLELGCGIGNDAVGFLASPRVSSYTGTDISKEALAAHGERVATARGARPDVPYSLLEGDFVGLLKQWKARGAGAPPVNFIYSYSSLHYFSSAEVTEIFTLVREILAPSRGVFAFAIKGYGSVWDGQGVPLYRPDVWINFDGQSRWFPSNRAVAAMVDSHGFELFLHDRHEHWSYSELGKRDVFHYVLCTPRATGWFEI